MKDDPIMARMTIELIRDPEYGGFTARVPDLPAYGEGETKESAIADLQEAIRAYIEAFGLEDAVSRITPALEVTEVDWNLAELARA
jgi:predicted RNase H-like HicB family nuclease